MEDVKGQIRMCRMWKPRRRIRMQGKETWKELGGEVQREGQGEGRMS